MLDYYGGQWLNHGEAIELAREEISFRSAAASDIAIYEVEDEFKYKSLEMLFNCDLQVA